MTGAPHLALFSRDVGFHKPRPLSVKGVDDHKHQGLLPVESDRWTAVESDISRRTSEIWGNPSFVTDCGVTADVGPPQS
jgi:hypothetical protein